MIIPFYPHLPNNWEDYEFLEDKMIPQRRIKKYKRWSHGYIKTRIAYNKAEKILNRYVGKPFKEALAKFMKSAKYDKGWKPIKEVFLDLLDTSPDSCRSNEYYIDSDYNIQKYQASIKPTSKIEILKVKWNIHKFPLSSELLALLKPVFGNNIYTIVETEYTVDQAREIISKISKQLYAFNSNLKGLESLLQNSLCIRYYPDVNKMISSQLFIPTEYREVKNFTKTSRKERIRAFQEQLKKRRNYEKQLELERSLEFIEYLKTYRKRIHENEKSENSITIERLGFDEETSFRGEFYHGQKRKKRKNLK